MSKYEIDYYTLTKRWFNDNGFLHRKDGPAVEYANGSKSWHINGKLHREAGPAIEYISGEKNWFYHGKLIECNSQEEFIKIIKLIAFW